MKESEQSEAEVYRFIRDKIESVPHLEALLLLWNTRPECWTPENLATRLYISQDESTKLLQDLSRDGLVAPQPNVPGQYCYRSESTDADRLVEEVDRTYRQQLVKISKMIHEKAPLALRDFARAFRFTKEEK